MPKLSRESLIEKFSRPLLSVSKEVSRKPLETIVVTISRHWENPQIKTTISEKSISLECSLEDFKRALKQEIGSVRWIFKTETFEKRVDDSICNILEKIKAANTNEAIRYARNLGLL